MMKALSPEEGTLCPALAMLIHGDKFCPPQLSHLFYFTELL